MPNKICLDCGAPIPMGRATRCKAHARPRRIVAGTAWRSVRAKVLKRDGYRCRYCGEKATSVDHVLPHSRGGTDAPENLVACCRWCNTSKGSKTPAEWRRGELTE